MSDPRVEVMARALYETEDAAGPDAWPPASESTAAAYRGDAAAYIKDIDAADTEYVRVPTRLYHAVLELLEEEAADCDLPADDDDDRVCWLRDEWKELHDKS